MNAGSCSGFVLSKDTFDPALSKGDDQRGTDAKDKPDPSVREAPPEVLFAKVGQVLPPFDRYTGVLLQKDCRTIEVVVEFGLEQTFLDEIPTQLKLVLPMIVVIDRVVLRQVAVQQPIFGRREDTLNGYRPRRLSPRQVPTPERLPWNLDREGLLSCNGAHGGFLNIQRAIVGRRRSSFLRSGFEFYGLHSRPDNTGKSRAGLAV